MKTNLNLLPLDFRRRSLAWKCLYQWSIAIGVGVLLLAAALGLQWSRMHKSKNAWATLQNRAAPFQERLANIQEIMDELSRLHASESLLAEARRSGQAVQLLGLVSRSADESVQVQVFEFTSRLQKSEKKKGDKADTPQAGNVVNELLLEGVAIDNKAITRFTTGLQGGMIFDSVDPKKIGNANNGIAGDREYEILCLINEARQ